SSGKLYVGGAFTVAGTNVSAFVAQANITPLSPTLLCPANMTLDFVSAAGAPAFFAVTATDPCAGVTSVICHPPSGSTFPIGHNIVICSTTNSSGKGDQCSFTVTVRGPLEMKANVLSEMIT